MPFSIPAPLTAPLPYHFLSYGALLGTELYQTFVNTKVTYLALPPREFLRLQRRLFPIYFRTQVGLALLTIVTRPPTSLSRVSDRGMGAGVASVLPNTTTFLSWWDTPAVTDVLPLALVAVVGVANWLVYGPETSKAGARRAVAVPSGSQERGQTPDDQGAKFDEEKVKQVKCEFSRNHAMCIHLNLVGVVATIWYAFLFARRVSLA
ncbi:hypothetical protein BJY01DRAFT_225707 [Aspergillus pseudoustus]|uniref:TMEM205-like domain-containing protein n=1 Tax=Aspergillus pseudoustus TaxID=1810923 RepID=A0ABR4IYC7_9EURO